MYGLIWRVMVIWFYIYVYVLIIYVVFNRLFYKYIKIGF